MRSIFIFPCIMTMIYNFTIIFIFHIYIFKFSIQSLPLYTSCLFPMLLNNDILGIEKPDRIYLILVVNEFSGLFLDLSVFSIKHSRST